MMRIVPGLLLTALTAGYVSASSAQVPAPRVWTTEGQAPAISAVADIIDLNGKSIGSAQFRQGPRGVVLDVNVSGLAPGPHGVHFHATGLCDARAKFASAAHHMGLDLKPHGFLHPKDHHAGDLPNIIAHADGSASAQFFTPDIRVSGKASKSQMLLLDTDGSSLIIHEKTDDGFTQPSGGAGGRVACGTIKLP
jgi:superoxide dismutase, Cu-Zn family